MECARLQGRGSRLKHRVDGIAPEKVLPDCRRRLVKLVVSELNFLSRLASSGVESTRALLSSNFGHVEAVVEMVENPLVYGVFAVMQRFPPLGAHVDLVGFYDNKPAWIIVSDRNPRHILWKDLRAKAVALREAAIANPVARPASIIFFFAKGIEQSVAERLEMDFRARKLQICKPEGEADEWILVEDENGEETSVSSGWVSLEKEKVLYQVEVEGEAPLHPFCHSLKAGNLGTVQDSDSTAFYAILADVHRLWKCSSPGEQLKLVNLDTTALIAMVSGISNESAANLASCSDEQLEKKFHSFGHFFKTQALLELERPFLPEVASVFKERQPVISRFAWEEFQSIVTVVGGPGEQKRAAALGECFGPFIVPDSPSERVLALPVTGKIQHKHKIVFGTGDSMRAPTLTSNVSFIRAAIAKVMPLGYIEHRPLALTRD